MAEAAELLGVAEGTVKSRCSRGRVALARVLLGRGRRRTARAAATRGNLTVGPRVAPRGGEGRRAAAPHEPRRRHQERRASAVMRDDTLTTTCSPTSRPTCCRWPRRAPSRRTSWRASGARSCSPTPSASAACCSRATLGRCRPTFGPGSRPPWRPRARRPTRRRLLRRSGAGGAAVPADAACAAPDRPTRLTTSRAAAPLPGRTMATRSMPLDRRGVRAALVRAPRRARHRQPAPAVHHPPGCPRGCPPGAALGPRGRRHGGGRPSWPR